MRPLTLVLSAWDPDLKWTKGRATLTQRGRPDWGKEPGTRKVRQKPGEGPATGRSGRQGARADQQKSTGLQDSSSQDRQREDRRGSRDETPSATEASCTAGGKD